MWVDEVLLFVKRKGLIERRSCMTSTGPLFLRCLISATSKALFGHALHHGIRIVNFLPVFHTLDISREAGNRISLHQIRNAELLSHSVDKLVRASNSANRRYFAWPVSKSRTQFSSLFTESDSGRSPHLAYFVLANYVGVLILGVHNDNPDLLGVTMNQCYEHRG